MPQGPEATFKAFLAEGRFMIQRSRSTGRHCFYPRLAIPGTGEADLDWVTATGRGTVYSITVTRAREGNWNVALIDLEEGPRMMSTVAGVETCPIGTPVRARIADLPTGPAVVFDIDTGAA
ncbi:MAG: nucleic acid-binding protein [Paracoccus denitrificans]|uniref:Nucleic acid-binding protein n=1 Tax=Paracoccus denitrificans TaxID=266 RepID=A0A533I4J7_PARDE|nr:MAG: nucleic acid-binding protein [Paracoccus denitrificans]